MSKARALGACLMLLVTQEAARAAADCGRARVRVLRSRDGGFAWKGVDTEGVRTTFGRVTVHPRSPGVLFLATDRGIYVRRDGAWRRTYRGRSDGCIREVLIDERHPRRLYTGTYCDALVILSRDGGRRWRVGAVGNPGGTTIAIDPTRPSILYAVGGYGGVWRSTDYGRKWATPELPSVDVEHAFAVHGDASAPGTVYIGFTGETTSAGVLKSTDYGATFRHVAFPNENIHTFAMDPFVPGTVLAGADGGLWRSTDWGETWGPLAFDDLFVQQVVASPATPGTLYVVSSDWIVNTSTLYRSVDNGRSWSPMTSHGLTRVGAIALDPRDSMTMYITGCK